MAAIERYGTPVAEPARLRLPGRREHLRAVQATLTDLVAMFGPPDTSESPAWVIRVWHRREASRHADVVLYPDRDATWVIAGYPADGWAAHRVVLAISDARRAAGDDAALTLIPPS